MSYTDNNMIITLLILSNAFSYSYSFYSLSLDLIHGPHSLPPAGPALQRDATH